MHITLNKLDGGLGRVGSPHRVLSEGMTLLDLPQGGGREPMTMTQDSQKAIAVLPLKMTVVLVVCECVEG